MLAQDDAGIEDYVGVNRIGEDVEGAGGWQNGRG